MKTGFIGITKSVEIYKDEEGQLYLRDMNGEIVEDETSLNSVKQFLKENDNE